MEGKLNLTGKYIKNKVFEFILYAFSISLIVPLFLIIFMIIQRGLKMITPQFIFSAKSLLGQAGGGIGKDILGTLILVSLAVLFATPIGIAVGIFVNENKKSRITFYVRWAVEILHGIPSIIVGMVVAIWVVKIFDKTALAGSIALSMMMLPVVIKSTEETLKLIPDTLKEASIALGVPYYKTILKVILPSSVSGIMTGVLLGIARIAGETAPLLFTAFGNDWFNTNILKPIASLPLLIYNYGTSPYDVSHDVAWGASFVLIAFVLTLNLTTKLVVRRWKIKF